MVPQHSQQLEAIAFMVSVENQRSDLLAWYSVKAEGEAEAELAYLWINLVSQTWSLQTMWISWCSEQPSLSVDVRGDWDLLARSRSQSARKAKGSSQFQLQFSITIVSRSSGRSQYGSSFS